MTMGPINVANSSSRGGSEPAQCFESTDPEIKGQDEDSIAPLQQRVFAMESTILQSPQPGLEKGFDPSMESRPDTPTPSLTRSSTQTASDTTTTITSQNSSIHHSSRPEPKPTVYATGISSFDNHSISENGRVSTWPLPSSQGSSTVRRRVLAQMAQGSGPLAGNYYTWYGSSKRRHSSHHEQPISGVGPLDGLLGQSTHAHSLPISHSSATPDGPQLSPSVPSDTISSWMSSTEDLPTIPNTTRLQEGPLQGCTVRVPPNQHKPDTSHDGVHARPVTGLEEPVNTSKSAYSRKAMQSVRPCKVSYPRKNSPPQTYSSVVEATKRQKRSHHDDPETKRGQKENSTVSVSAVEFEEDARSQSSVDNYSPSAITTVVDSGSLMDSSTTRTSEKIMQPSPERDHVATNTDPGSRETEDRR